MNTNYIVRKYNQKDLSQMINIWNEIVNEGVAFPQDTPLTHKTGSEFFAAQTYCGVAENTADGTIAGLYILHPNNVGRCGHICNASYAVKSALRGNRIGRQLVEDCILQGRLHGFGVLQFNAVVAENTAARRLYENLGFTQLGTIPKGFKNKNGTFSDICPYYRTL